MVNHNDTKNIFDFLYPTAMLFTNLVNNISKKTIISLIGKPASGKTVLAEIACRSEADYKLVNNFEDIKSFGKTIVLDNSDKFSDKEIAVLHEKIISKGGKLILISQISNSSCKDLITIELYSDNDLISLSLV